MQLAPAWRCTQHKCNFDKPFLELSKSMHTPEHSGGKDCWASALEGAGQASLFSPIDWLLLHSVHKARQRRAVPCSVLCLEVCEELEI